FSREVRGIAGAFAMTARTTTGPVRLDSVEQALEALAAARPVAVVDAAVRENEGDLIVPAHDVASATVAFMIRNTSGVHCVPLPRRRLVALGLPPMSTSNEDPKNAAYAVSVYAKRGITTGIAAADLARTARCLAAADTD